MQALKILVVGLGVLIVISIGLLGWGFYSKLKPPESGGKGAPDEAAPGSWSASPGLSAPPAAAAFGEIRVPLPAGCTALEMRPTIDRLYVRTGPTGLCERILVFDNAGRLLGSIVLAP